jgi:hypothetical protein
VSTSNLHNGVDSSESKGEFPDEDGQHKRRNTELMLQAKPVRILLSHLYR